jgi:fucose 4-O-acetylase-like acetyltransferase
MCKGVFRGHLPLHSPVTDDWQFVTVAQSAWLVLAIALSALAGYCALLVRDRCAATAAAAVADEELSIAHGSAPVPPSKPQLELHAVDHAKFFLNASIICNHTFSAGRVHSHNGSAWALAYYCWAESFVMLTFAFISGFLSKGALNLPRAERTVSTIWAPYAVLNALHSWSHATWSRVGERGFWAHSRYLMPDLYNPTPAIAWYLQCWITWKLLLPYLKTVEGKGVRGKLRLFVVSLALSWLGGYWMVSRHAHFHLDTAIGMLPAFVGGYVTPHEVLALVRPRAKAAAAAVHLAGVLLIFHVCYSTYEQCDTRNGSIMRGTTLVVWEGVALRRSYFADAQMLRAECGELHECRLSYYLHWTQRAVVHAMGAVMGGSFLLMMPNWRTSASEHGRHSLYAYLLQPILYLPFCKRLFSALHALVGRLVVQVPGCASPLHLPEMMLLSLCATYIMTSEAVRRWSCVILEPTYLNFLRGRPYAAKPHLRSVLFLLLVYVGHHAPSYWRRGEDGATSGAE